MRPVRKALRPPGLHALNIALCARHTTVLKREKSYRMMAGAIVESRRQDAGGNSEDKAGPNSGPACVSAAAFYCCATWRRELSSAIQFLNSVSLLSGVKRASSF